MDGPGPLSSEGVPYEIRRFSIRGTLASSLTSLEDGGVASLSSAARGTHRDQMPLENEVINFPG
jgi:hypothetical protein